MLSTNPILRQFLFLLMNGRVKKTSVEIQKLNVWLKDIFPQGHLLT